MAERQKCETQFVDTVILSFFRTIFTFLLFEQQSAVTDFQLKVLDRISQVFI